MRVLILDPFHGAAGDMVTAALLDCGADSSLVLRAMGSVVASPTVSTVTRCGIRATRIETNAGHSHRSLEDVLKRCGRADAPRQALEMAHRVFARIAAAEEQVHGGTPRFHEVGADDAIADVIGACTALVSLQVERVVVLPLALGHGVVKGAHGTYPVPAPATIAILKGSGLALKTGDGEGELCTPTGAALLAEFSSTTIADPGAYTIVNTGYGAGTRDPKGVPNVLRAMLAETTPSRLPQDTVDVLETNTDDVSGEVIAHAIARCMEEGARDACAIPIVMKKGRPGHLVRVICTQDKSAALAELLARELGTLGIRCSPMTHRFVADRTVEDIGVTLLGKDYTIPVKFGSIAGAVFTVKPEFQAAHRLAEETGMAVRDVLQAATDAGWRRIRGMHEKQP